MKASSLTYFTDSHEWLHREENEATVGITRYAQEELGEIVFVQLPKIGDTLEKGSAACILESTKAAADVYSPATGTVIAINEELLKDPTPINQSPEDLGWLYRIQVTKPEEVSSLFDFEEYQKNLQQS